MGFARKVWIILDDEEYAATSLPCNRLNELAWLIRYSFEVGCGPSFIEKILCPYKWKSVADLMRV